MMKNILWFDYVAISIIVIAVFVISYCGFFVGDDLVMAYGVSSLSDVFEHTKMFYFTYGGRLFSVVSQYLFSGVLGNNRIWFAIANTLFFVSLIMICGRLIKNNKKGLVFRVLLFSLLFWFLCPVPKHTLFWVAGATTYLWANTLSFAFLLLFLKYNDDNFSVFGKLGLFVMSFFAATEFITCVSICGAFLVYYAFHIKKFKGNAIPFVVGFAIGSVFLLLAPGNYARLTNETGISRSLFDIKYLLHHLVYEIVKYKALWMFLFVFVFGWVRNKAVVKSWVKNNSILLLSLGWSVIAFCVIFSSPANRALFFTETLSLVMFLKFLYDNYGMIKIRSIDGFLSRNLFVVRSAIMILLFVLFMVDSAFAIVETKKQNENYKVLLNEIVDSGGVVVLNRMISSHRMIYAPSFNKPTWNFLADKYSLDSVHVYPYYCQDKFYKQASPLENIFVDEDNVVSDGSIFGKLVCMIARIESERLQESSNYVVFTINYSRPKKWYKSWLDKWRNYQYDRTIVVERDKPAICFDGYCYYIIWLKQENMKNLKSVKYKIE